MAEETTRRIVLLGKTGSGKSSLANTLFGEKYMFLVSSSASSQTKLCQSETKTIYGRSIQLVDTPGLFDTDDSDELSPELLRCMTECAPGPHAVLIVKQMGRFTKEEQDVVRLILENFSEEVLRYTTVVFTHGDELDEGQTIKEWVKENKVLNDLVQKCGGRCHVFDNKRWKHSQDEYRSNQYQIEQLLQTIDQTVRGNRGGYYTNEKLQKAQKKIEETTKKIQQSNPPSVKVGCLMGAALGSGAGPIGMAVGALFGAAAGAVLEETMKKH